MHKHPFDDLSWQIVQNLCELIDCLDHTMPALEQLNDPSVGFFRTPENVVDIVEQTAEC